MPRRLLKPRHKGMYIVGFLVSGIGVALFVVSFSRFIAHLGSFDLDRQDALPMTAVLAGTALLLIGAWLMYMGFQGTLVASNSSPDQASAAPTDSPSPAAHRDRTTAYVVCPQCQARNASAARFCDQCGRSLAG